MREFLLRLTLVLFMALSLPLAAGAQSARPVITGISAVSDSAGKITVSWSLPAKTEGTQISAVLVYRDSRPLTESSALAGIAPVARLGMGADTYTDTVSDGIEYYYAVILEVIAGNMRADEELYYDEELDAAETPAAGTAYTVLLPGVNATVKGTRARGTAKKQAPVQAAVPERTYEENQLRDRPLPFIDILGGERRKKSGTISRGAEKKALSLAEGERPAPQVLEPYIFEEDLLSPQGGDDYLLFEVLRDSFIRQDYNASVTALKKFLAQNRTAAVTRRAQFYLGESYYYTGHYPEALSCFLSLEEAYPSLSRRWMESTLDLYSIP